MFLFVFSFYSFAFLCVCFRSWRAFVSLKYSNVNSVSSLRANVAINIVSMKKKGRNEKILSLIKKHFSLKRWICMKTESTWQYFSYYHSLLFWNHSNDSFWGMMAGRSFLISAACVHWLPGDTLNKKNDINEKFNNCFISFIFILPKQNPSEFTTTWSDKLIERATTN